MHYPLKGLGCVLGFNYVVKMIKKKWNSLSYASGSIINKLKKNGYG